MTRQKIKEEKQEQNPADGINETAPVATPSSDIVLQQVLKELQEVKTKLALAEAEKKAATDALSVKGNAALRVVDPANKADYKNLMERYSKQNPVKFAAKKATLESKLNS